MTSMTIKHTLNGKTEETKISGVGFERRPTRYYCCHRRLCESEVLRSILFLNTSRYLFINKLQLLLVSLSVKSVHVDGHIGTVRYG